MAKTDIENTQDSNAIGVALQRIVRLEDVPEITVSLAGIKPTEEDWRDAWLCMKIMRWNTAVRSGLVKPNKE